MACAYTDTLSGRMTYAVYNVAAAPLSVHFFGAKDTTVTVPHGLTLISGAETHTVTTIEDEEETIEPDPMAWDLPYPNLALHKPVTASSFENAGCVAVNLTDGNTDTRWGSEHRDGEWAMVDLGEVCFIDHLILRWETAFASEYELALSSDGSTWHSAIYASAGGVERISLPFRDGMGVGPSRARYIRLTGLQRATQYGTSLYELEAYGRPLTGDPETVFAVALSASDTVLLQGQTTTLTTTAYNYNGAVLSTSSEQKTYPDYGLFTETRMVGGCSASLTIIVMETEMAAKAQVLPAEVTMPLGTEQEFVVSILNQFGEPMDTCRSVYRATQVGNYELIFPCFEMRDTALVHVLPFEEVNLALHKPATASGAEGDGTAAPKAVDGDMKTRWSSRFQDNEWIAVNLENCYLLTQVRLVWENAYATSFDIEISDDGENYTTVKSISGAKGGTQIHDIRQNGEPVEAQFVRVFCKTRNTGYGSSLWELEVYGEGLCEQEVSAIENHQLQTTNYKFIKNGRIYISRNGAVYTIDGRQCVLPQE